MTFVISILVLVLLAACALVFELGRAHRPGSRDSDFEALQARLRRNAAGVYQPVTRLFRQEDQDYLAGEPALSERMRSDRQTALRLFLREMRADFREAWTVCRMLAPVSGASDFVPQLLRQWVSFHLLYGMVWVRCHVGAAEGVQNDLRQLIDSLAALRRGAADLLQTGQQLGFGAASA